MNRNDMETTGARARTPEAGLPRWLLLTLAGVTGAAVANLYYVQPLLNLVADAFDVPSTVAALLVTCAQLGYLAGLALLVPLADLRESRRLVTTLLVGAAAALAACAAAPDLAVLAGALVAVGALSVVAQILVPLAATLAPSQERGAAVGAVAGGLLIGIVTARTASGLLADLGGWRLVFAVAAAAMLGFAVLLSRVLPAVPPRQRLSYLRTLASVRTLVVEEPMLRRRMCLGALHMAGFMVLWTSLALMLGDPPYGYPESTIGLFGLAGAAGAIVAPVAGRWVDRGHGRRTLGAFLSMIFASWALLAVGGGSLAALLAGVVLLDLGVQGSHITHQSALYALRPDARSRMNTAYMVAVFLGGVVGSVLSAAVFGAGGWLAACALGAALAGTGLLVHSTDRASVRYADIPSPN